MSLKNWVTTQMEILLGFSDPGLVEHILNLEDEPETRAYCKDIFGDQNIKFIDELVKRRKFKPMRRPVNEPHKYQKSNKPVQSAAELAMSIFGETYNNAPAIVDKRSKGKKETRKESPKPPKEKRQEEFEEGLQGKWGKKIDRKTFEQTQFVMPDKYRPQEELGKTKKKKRPKYRNIEEGTESYLLPGRNKCDCQVSGTKKSIKNYMILSRLKNTILSTTVFHAVE